MNNKNTRLTLSEREEISRGIWADESFSDIAARGIAYKREMRLLYKYK